MPDQSRRLGRLEMPIHTPRTRVVPFTEEHLTHRYVAWLNDPHVVRYSDQRFRRHTMESCRDYMATFRDTESMFLAIIADTDLGHIGTMTTHVDTNHSIADVGILIGERAAWGNGYATEAWVAVCRSLLESGIRKVTAGTLEVNVPMVNLMRRAEMVDDGRRRKQAIFEGREVDVVHAALFRTDLP